MNRWRKTKENGYYNTSKGEDEGKKIIIRKKISKFFFKSKPKYSGSKEGEKDDIR
jgi:hypothetical protein